MSKTMSMVFAGVSRVARAVKEIINVFKKPSSDVHEKKKKKDLKKKKKKDLKKKKKDLKQKEKDLIKRRTLYPISAHVYPLENYMKDGSLKSLMRPPTVLASSTASSATLSSSPSSPTTLESSASSPTLSSSPSSPTTLESAVQCLEVSTYVQPAAKFALKNVNKAAFKNVLWSSFNARLFHPFIQCIVSIPKPLKHFIRTEISTTATTVFLTMKKQKNQQRLRCAAAPLVEISQKESLSSTLRQHSFPVSLEPVAVASTPYTHLSKVFVCPNCTKYYLKGSSPVVMFCSLDCKDESMKKPKMWRSKRCEIQKNLLSEAKASGLSKSFLQWPYQRKDVHIAAVKRSRI